MADDTQTAEETKRDELNLPPIGLPLRVGEPQANAPAIPSPIVAAGMPNAPAGTPASPAMPVQAPAAIQIPQFQAPTPQKSATQRLFERAGQVQNPFARILAQTGAGILRGADLAGESLAPRLAMTVPGSEVNTDYGNRNRLGLAMKTYEDQLKPAMETQAEQARFQQDTFNQNQQNQRERERLDAETARQQTAEAASEKARQDAETAAATRQQTSEAAQADRQNKQIAATEKARQESEAAAERRTQEEIASRENIENKRLTATQNKGSEKQREQWQNLVDRRDDSRAYIQGGKFDGAGDYQLLMSFVDATKPSSGFRFTNTELQTILSAANLGQRAEALYTKAKGGAFLPADLRTQMERTLETAGARAEGRLGGAPEGGGNYPANVKVPNGWKWTTQGTQMGITDGKQFRPYQGK